MRRRSTVAIPWPTNPPRLMTWVFESNDKRLIPTRSIWNRLDGIWRLVGIFSGMDTTHINLSSNTPIRFVGRTTRGPRHSSFVPAVQQARQLQQLWLLEADLTRLMKTRGRDFTESLSHWLSEVTVTEPPGPGRPR